MIFFIRKVVLNIFSFLSAPFELIDPYKNRLWLIFGAGTISIVFMFLYAPFNLNLWYHVSGLQLFYLVSGFGFIGMTALLLAEFVIRPVLKIHSFTRATFIFWILGEIFLMALFMLFFYNYGDLDRSFSVIFRDYIDNVKYCALIMVIPYSVIISYFHLHNIYKQKSAISIVSNSLVHFKDENGVYQLAVDLDHLLFIKSSDNYVEVYFEKDQILKKELVRTSLKRLQKELAEWPIKRCHRSYMVNTQKITFGKKDGRNLLVQLRNFPQEQIMVSRNYMSNLEQVLPNIVRM